MPQSDAILMDAAPKAGQPSAPFLSIGDVVKEFAPSTSLGDRINMLFGKKPRPRFRAVDHVSLQVRRGETLGIVGESGSGKSTLARIVCGIVAPTSGRVELEGATISRQSDHRGKKSRRTQMIFQDPYSSLDPRMRIGETIAEGPLAHRLESRQAIKAYVAAWLQRVGLPPDCATRYPHQFSGGQRQRVAIARALAMQPDVLICDEPVASLDVSIQAQIINLFLELRRDLSLTCLFISHDISVIRHISDRVAVMTKGTVVEEGATEEVLASPRHPYTQTLIASVPKLHLE